MTATPIPISGDIKFYQPIIKDILNMGEEMYWSLLKVWDLSRKEMIVEETEETLKLTNFEIWQAIMFNNKEMQNRLIASVDCFLHTKIEFLPISNTIMIGEGDSSILLNNSIYLFLQEISKSMSDMFSEKKDDQFQETENMSEREKQLIKKMRESAAKLDKIKNGEKDTKDRLVKQIISLVAIGGYTYDQVYSMTIVQMIYLLKKYVAIQQYELYIALSPYRDSKNGQTIEHWLDT